jgi:hypothetical protein
MKYEMPIEMVKKIVDSGNAAEHIKELYETISGMARVIETMFGDITTQTEMRQIYDNEFYKDYVFGIIESQYGDGGIDFLNFCVAYEIGRRSINEQ